MTDEEKKICHLCNNEADRFEVCENCGRVICLNCITTSSGAILKLNQSPKYPRCGSDRIAIYDKGKKEV